MLVATQKRKLGFGLHRVVQWSCPGRIVRGAVWMGLVAATMDVTAQITAGNLLVYRVDGSGAALGADAAVVHIDEYAISGSPLSASLVQTITFPFTGPGPLLTGTGIGTSAGGITEGKLTISPNGRWVGVAGYNAPENTANVATASGINRTIGRIDTTDGSIDVSTSGPLVTGFNSARSAVFDDTGTNIWTALHGSGTNFGLTHLTLGQTTPGTQLLDSPRNVRGVRIFGGQLYQFADHPGNLGVFRVGTGLPTTGPQPLTGLPGISGSGGLFQQIYGMFRIQGEDRRFIHALGAGDRFTGEQVPWELIPENGIVVAAGYLKLRSWSDNALVEMFRETRQRQSTTVLNVCLPNHQNDIAGRCLRLLPHVDVFVLNEDEALALTGQSEVRAQARILRSAGARIVIITRGSHGLYAETGTCTFEMGAFRVPIVDPSGCGDCFTAGLVFGLLRRWELERTLQFASAVGALNATALGCTTGVPPFTEVERFLGKRCSEIAQELITA